MSVCELHASPCRWHQREVRLLLPAGQPGLAVAALVAPLDRCAFGQAEASDEQQPGQFFGNSLNEIATHS